MATVPVTVVAKKPWAEYDSAVAYMQDIETGSLLQSIHDGVRNLTELEHYIPLALIYAKPVRDLEFNDGVRPNDVKSFGSKSLWENIQSCLVYITGNEVPHAGGKHSCIKKFRRIVVPKLVYDYHFEDPDNLRKKFEKSKRKSYLSSSNRHFSLCLERYQSAYLRRLLDRLGVCQPPLRLRMVEMRGVGSAWFVESQGSARPS